MHARNPEARAGAAALARSVAFVGPEEQVPCCLDKHQEMRRSLQRCPHAVQQQRDWGRHHSKYIHLQKVHKFSYGIKTRSLCSQL
jgi:hypothetical protein